MSRLRSVGAALLGAGAGYLAGTWITTYAHARARDESTTAFVADSKRQIRASDDLTEYWTERHPGRVPEFGHEEFSETLDPERWHSEGIDIDVVGAGDVENADEDDGERGASSGQEEGPDGE